MTFSLEVKKLKRTGFFPAFIIGGILAASFPVLHITIRTDMFVQQTLSPLDTLMNANWQMIAMLNLLYLVIGACIIYHTEFIGRGIVKMQTLPKRMETYFAAKAVVLFLALLFVLLLEIAAFAFCSCIWFSLDEGFWLQLLKILGYELMLLLPGSILTMVIASLSPNMWISLGIGVICVFVATMLPTDNFALSLFPFAMPFQTLSHGENITYVSEYLLASFVESILFVGVKIVLEQLRRRLA